MRRANQGDGRRLVVAGVVSAGIVVALRAEHARRLRDAAAAAAVLERPRVETAPAERAVVVDVAEPPVPAPVEPVEQRRRRLPAALWTLAALGVLAGAGYAASLYLPGNDVARPTLVAVSVPTPTRVTAAATTPATTPAAPATTATAVATTARQTTPPPATTAAATTSASPGFVPARTFLWPAARQATGYRVAFVHDGAVVFQHVTKVARVELPASFRFEAGRYSWSVWALPQARNARPLAASEFVLTPAGAAAANRP